jgi:hypothetical protein
MWTEHLSQLDNKVIKLSIQRDHRTLSCQQVLTAWEQEPDFCRFFVGTLAALPFTAFFWEMPPLLVSTLGQDFECVFVDSPDLAVVDPQPEVFREHFLASRDGVANFGNLGGDATLVAPEPDGGLDYSHIAQFNRCAPLYKQVALWQQVGKLSLQQVGAQALWLSTSGLGVFWLHIRFDRYPKYYTHTPYKTVVPD